MWKGLEDGEDTRFGEEGGQMALQSAKLHLGSMSSKPEPQLTHL